MQPSTDTSGVPECSFILNYNAKKIRKPGRGTGCAIHRHLLQIYTRINIPGAPRQSRFWILRLPAASLLVAAWYGPVRSKSRPASECRAYWKLWAESLWKARRLYPECLIIAGGNANVVLDVLHPDCAMNSIAREFENLILVEHKLTLVNTRCPRRTHTIHALDLMAHSPGINIMDFFVHDGRECPCGKTRCGAIARSDHRFLTATLDLHRPADSLLSPRCSWNKASIGATH